MQIKMDPGVRRDDERMSVESPLFANYLRQAAPALARVILSR